MAQDRLWQLDLLRRVARGQLSEILGKDTLPIDKQSALYALVWPRSRPDSPRRRVARRTGCLFPRRERFH